MGKTSFFTIMALMLLVSSEALQFRSKRELTLAELEGIDEQKYLQNRKAVEFQIQCVVYDGPCDPLGQLLKRHIKSALLRECSEEHGDFCTEDNLARISHVMDFVEQNYPEAYADAKKKYLE